MVITSLENEKVKNLVRLQRKKYRDDTDTYVVEGVHLVEEAFRAGAVLEVFLLENERSPIDMAATYVSLEVMRKISTMDTPSTVVALCRKMESKEILGNRILLLDQIQDPGNLGTIIRSSVAFGVDTIILSKDTVDLYNPKVLRATQGIFFHIPIVIRDTIDTITELKENDYIIYGTNVVNGMDARSLEKEKRQKFCLIMGNEGNGVSTDVQAMCDQNLYIPMKKDVESLNVGVACSILLYELGR